MPSVTFHKMKCIFGERKLNKKENYETRRETEMNADVSVNELM